VKSTIGHVGPSTDEKWRSKGARLLRGRSSIMAATFLADLKEKIGLICDDQTAEVVGNER